MFDLTYKRTIRAKRKTLEGKNTRYFAYKCHITGKNLDVIGDKNVVNGIRCVVRGNFCVFVGDNSLIIGKGNVVIGDNNEVRGDECEVEGNNNTIVGKDCEISGTHNTYNGSPADTASIQLPSLTHADEESTDSEKTCVICMTNKRCCAIRPCGHVCLCVRCSHSMVHGEAFESTPVLQKKVVCPLCRNKVEEIMLIFNN